MKTLNMTKYNFYTDGKTKVVAVSTYAGKVVRGVAKCDVNDTFSLENGIDKFENKHVVSGSVKMTP